MAELHREVKTGVDISSTIIVMTYTYTGNDSKIVLVRVEVGDAVKPIAGGQNYEISALIDDVPVTPVSTILVPVSQDRAIMQSRQVVLEKDDVLKVRIKGAPGDTDVNLVSFIMDATPATLTEITGNGEVLVNHDYGGDDVLSYKRSTGQGIGDATVQAFLASDYNAGRRTRNYIQAESTTDVNGRWSRAMMLDPAEYVLVYYKQGEYGPDTYELTVS